DHRLDPKAVLPVIGRRQQVAELFELEILFHRVQGVNRHGATAPRRHEKQTPLLFFVAPWRRGGSFVVHTNCLLWLTYPIIRSGVSVLHWRNCLRSSVRKVLF